MHGVDHMSRPAIAFAATKHVARRLIEAGSKTDHLAEDLCVELGLPVAPRPVLFEIAKGGKGASTKPPVCAAASPPKRLDATAKPDKVDDATRPLRAGEPIGQLLCEEALAPLQLPPTIADMAPLLQLYMENATATQIGASTIVQRNFRAMRLRRKEEARARFYMPRSIAKKT